MEDPKGGVRGVIENKYNPPRRSRHLICLWKEIVCNVEGVSKIELGKTYEVCAY